MFRDLKELKKENELLVTALFKLRTENNELYKSLADAQRKIDRLNNIAALEKKSRDSLQRVLHNRNKMHTYET